MVFTPMQHQVEGFNFDLNNPYPGTLLWHEMGLGKTILALMILRQFVYDLRCKGVSAPKILLLLPKSILNQWKAECHKFTPEIFQCIVFLPYSKLDKAKTLIMYHDFRAIVMDESHYLKSPETLRMSDLCDLLKEIEKSAGAFEHGKYLQLSGTPMLNHAGELFTAWALLTSKSPLDAVAKLQDEKRYNDWKKSFTKSKTKSWESRWGGKKYGESAEGVANENMLTQLIGPVVHYKRAADCLDLPIKQDIHINLGLEDDKLLLDANIEKPEAYMAVLERIAKAKTPHAIDWVKDFFSGSQEQLVIFSPYIFPLKQLLAKNKKRAVIVTGEQNDSERHEAITRFQRGEARIFLTSYKAGGEGINLQCAHHTLYLGYPWSPKIVDQARARTHRKGQMTRTLHHFLMSGENDSNILRLIDRKDEAITAVENHLLTMNQHVTQPAPRAVDKWL